MHQAEDHGGFSLVHFFFLRAIMLHIKIVTSRNPLKDTDVLSLKLNFLP
jgi:hypothetical protein